MTRAQIEPLLQPGDCLLYRPVRFDLRHPGWIFGALIMFKTWHAVSHCELYVGKGRSAASRDGKGVALYPWRDSELAYVLRPTRPLDWKAFWTWYLSVDGQGYDWWGLVRFAWFRSVGGENNGKMFCSEFVTRAYRALRAGVFSDHEDADGIAPFEFLLSPTLQRMPFVS